MRILLSAYACEPNKGSEPGVGWNWVYNLALRDHKVFLVTDVRGRNAIEEELLKNPLPNLHVTFVDVPGWAKPFLKGQIGVYLRYFLWQRQAYIFSKHLVDEIDVIHHATWGSLTGGSRLWKMGKPFIFGPVGGGQITPNAFLKFFEKEQIKEQLRTFMTQNIAYFLPGTARTIRNSDVILATNKETLDLAQSMNANKVRFFLDTGLPLEYIPEVKPIHNLGKKFKIFWVGRVYPRKGLELTFAVLQHLNIPFEFNIVYYGPWEYKIPGWIIKYKLSGKVNCIGRVAFEELKKYYMENDIFLYTSLRESFGSQQLEAMAHGLPVVTLNQSGARDFIPDDAGIKIDVTTPEETTVLLAEAIERLWNEPELWKKMGVSAYRFACSQSWDKRVSRMEKIYEEVVKTIN